MSLTKDEHGATPVTGWFSYGADTKVPAEELSKLIRHECARQIGYQVVDQFEPFITTHDNESVVRYNLVVLSHKDYERLTKEHDEEE